MKLLSLLMFGSFMILNTAQAGQCYSAFKQAKELERVVSGVDFVSETDDSWKAFSSWVPVKKITEIEIRRVLKLGSKFNGEASYFEMDGQDELYTFLDNEIESYDVDGYDDARSQRKLKRLKRIIKKNFGKNVRLIKFGEGNGDSFFSGDHMIILIDENGCVLGLKADTAWT